MTQPYVRRLSLQADFRSDYHKGNIKTQLHSFPVAEVTAQGTNTLRPSTFDVDRVQSINTPAARLLADWLFQRKINRELCQVQPRHDKYVPGKYVAYMKTPCPSCRTSITRSPTGPVCSYYGALSLHP